MAAMTGTVERFGTKGYGWIRPDGWAVASVFFHLAQLVTGGGPPEPPVEGMKVSFELIETSKGPKAHAVRVLDR